MNSTYYAACGLEIPHVANDNLEAMIDLQNFFIEVNAKLDETLDNLVPTMETEPATLYSAMRWSLFAGGKRIRPALLVACGRAFGASEFTLYPVAAAVEMMHTYSLIHDDLPAMDDDDLRRGRETCHKKFGEAAAILAGDALQALAFETVANVQELSPVLRVRLISNLGEAAAKMVAGQELDLEAEGRATEVGDLEKIHRNKTGALLAMSARAGALIGGADGDDLSAVSGFGEQLGLLFQITDDLLDITQSTESLGKTAGKDVSARKATYPNAYGIKMASELARDAHASASEYLECIRPHSALLTAINDFVLHRLS
ncbi:MAG: polyprenyl synthetase family protein [Pyrinomonadaceae bacterium]